MFKKWWAAMVAGLINMSHNALQELEDRSREWHVWAEYENISITAWNQQLHIIYEKKKNTGI